MKTRLFFLVLLFICFSCGTNNKPLSEVQKEKIKGEVKEVVNTIIKGLKEVNFEVFIEPWLDSPDFVFISNGGGIYNYKFLMDKIKPVWSELLNHELALIDEKYAILDNSTVLCTMNCKDLVDYKDGHSVIADPMALLFIFKKINDEWKVIYGVHTFSPKSVNKSEDSQ